MIDATVRNPEAHTHTSAGKLHKQLTQQASADSPTCSPLRRGLIGNPEQQQGTKEGVGRGSGSSKSAGFFSCSSSAEGSSRRLRSVVLLCGQDHGLLFILSRECAGSCFHGTYKDTHSSAHIPASFYRYTRCPHVPLGWMGPM